MRYSSEMKNFVLHKFHDNIAWADIAVLFMNRFGINKPPHLLRQMVKKSFRVSRRPGTIRRRKLCLVKRKPT